MIQAATDTPKARKQVFLSFEPGAVGREWVQEFARSLERHGARVWFPEAEVKAGDLVAETIERGLRSSDIFVAILSSQSARQPSLFFEFGAAIGLGKRVVAVLPKGFDPALLPLPLRTRRFLLQEDPESTARALLQQAAAADSTDEQE